MKAAVAIKRYVEHDSERKVSAGELQQFKASCTHEEWQQFGRDAATNLGVEFEEVKEAA